MGNRVFQLALNEWLYLGAGALLVLLVLILTISLIAMKHKDEKYRLALEEQSSSIRIFIIDTKRSLVRYFNVTTLQHVSEISLADFYQHFPVSQQQRVINWINAITDPGTKCPDYLETDIHDHHARKQYFSLLQLEHFNPETGVIHIQSYLMKYMASSKNGANRNGLTTVNELESAINSGSHKRGFSFCYRFVYKRIADKDRDIEPLIFNQMKNALSPFIGGHRYLLQCSGNDLLMCDLRISERAKAIYLARAGLNSINRYLSLNGLTSTLDVRVGVVEHATFASGDASGIIEAAKNTALLAFEDNDLVLLYETGRRAKNNLSDSAYRTEVERIIEEKKIHYYFRPIYSVDKGKITGYFTKAVPYDAYFDSIEELKDYAVRTEDDRILFSTIVKDTIHLYLSGNSEEGNKLFFPVRIQERSHLLTTFGRLSRAKAASMVFLFNESDIHKNLGSFDGDAVIEYMKLLRVKGYEVGLFLNSRELQLPPALYAAFDYFAVGFAFAGSASDMDALVRSQLHALVEKLLKYQKPIIATDIEGWASIELIVSSGLRYVSSETFAPYDLMMNPPSPKSLKRIKEID